MFCVVLDAKEMCTVVQRGKGESTGHQKVAISHVDKLSVITATITQHLSLNSMKQRRTVWMRPTNHNFVSDIESMCVLAQPF